MLPTKFLVNLAKLFQRRRFYEIVQPEKELPMSVMFVNVSKYSPLKPLGEIQRIGTGSIYMKGPLHDFIISC
jgi:hypothetical protein